MADMHVLKIGKTYYDFIYNFSICVIYQSRLRNKQPMEAARKEEKKFAVELNFRLLHHGNMATDDKWKQPASKKAGEVREWAAVNSSRQLIYTLCEGC